jgi:hypothetical protein
MSLAIIIHIIGIIIIIIIIITGNDCEFFKIKVGPEKISRKPETISGTLYEICWPYAEYTVLHLSAMQV